MTTFDEFVYAKTERVRKRLGARVLLLGWIAFWSAAGWIVTVIVCR